MSHCFDFGCYKIRRSVFFLLMLAPFHVVADVVRDGTVGPDNTSQPVGPDFEIGEQFGDLRGGNLFHSFEEFSLTQDQTATFSATSPIDAIIGRVTGSNASNIDGLLRSTVPEAALYLMNPHGIVFGPNAQLDVSGAFHASTAETLQFSDDETFGTGVVNDPVLTAAAPEAFGFLGANAATIELNGSVLESTGDIELSAGSIAMNGGAQINATTDDARPGGDIVLRGSELVRLSGVDGDGLAGRIRAITRADGAGGSISIEARTVELRDGAVILAASEQSGDGGSISIEASERISLSGYDPRGSTSLISSVWLDQVVGPAEFRAFKTPQICCFRNLQKRHSNCCR